MHLVLLPIILKYNKDNICGSVPAFRINLQRLDMTQEFEIAHIFYLQNNGVKPDPQLLDFDHPISKIPALF